MKLVGGGTPTNGGNLHRGNICAKSFVGEGTASKWAKCILSNIFWANPTRFWRIGRALRGTWYLASIPFAAFVKRVNKDLSLIYNRIFMCQIFKMHH